MVGVLPLWGSWVMQACIQGVLPFRAAEQAVMGLPLMPFWLKIKIVAVASSQPFISFSISVFIVFCADADVTV